MEHLDTLKNLIKKSPFKSPTRGVLSFPEVVKELVNYRLEDSAARYKIVIGTDSEIREKGIDYVSVIAIHRIGKGGRYFWLRSFDNQNLDLRKRIYKEATLSLALAQALLEQGLENNNVTVATGKTIIEVIKELEKNSGNKKNLVFTNEIEIHVDIGNGGPTRDMIKEITGMIRGSGFFVKIKPEAFAAQSVADKHL